MIVSRPNYQINSRKLVKKLFKEREAMTIEECSKEKNILHIKSADFEISSSKIRLEIEQGFIDPNKIDNAVINYINKNNLYSKSV